MERAANPGRMPHDGSAQHMTGARGPSAAAACTRAPARCMWPARALRLRSTSCQARQWSARATQQVGLRPCRLPEVAPAFQLMDRRYSSA